MIGRLILAASLAVVGPLTLVACGGGPAPAPATPGAPEAAPTGPADTSCCCDYIKEEGDPESDTWSENQTYEKMSATDCSDLSGECGDAAACEAAADEPDAADA